MSDLVDAIRKKMELTVPGLTFRHYRSEADIPTMVEITNYSNKIDGNDWIMTVEETQNNYRHLVNCDLRRDMLIAEIDEQMIGYSRCWWEDQLDGTRNYSHFIRLHPKWRGKGIRQTVFQVNERHLGQIAAGHPPECAKFLTVLVSEGETTWAELVQNAGYQPIRYFMKMVRPSLNNIPSLPLPAGIQARCGSHAEWRQIWGAAREAFKDNWGEAEWTEEDFNAWTQDPAFDPVLFQIGWDGNEVAGGVLNYIDAEENEAYGRLRGYTQGIFVRQPWRKRGLAKALIACSLQMLKDMGLAEAALTVDAENTTGAVKLYTNMGFQRDKVTTLYRKPL